ALRPSVRADPLYQRPQLGVNAVQLGLVGFARGTCRCRPAPWGLSPDPSGNVALEPTPPPPAAPPKAPADPPRPGSPTGAAGSARGSVRRPEIKEVAALLSLIERAKLRPEEL